MTNEEIVFGKNKEDIPRDYRATIDYTDKRVDKIDDPNRKYINGFKAIKLGEETYGYVRESDGELMPYRYTNAYDFNKYGFAIVGREGAVTWINKDFRYLRNDRRSGCYGNEYAMSEDYLYDPYQTLYGFNSVGEFSKGDIPLSRIRMYDVGVIYFGTDGKVKKFVKYGGEKEQTYCKFYRGTPFNKDGIAIAEFDKERLILYAEGYCMSFDDIAKMALDRGFVDKLSEEAKEKCLKKSFK